MITDFLLTIAANVRYIESGVFVHEDFPKENQKQANGQLTLVKVKLAIFYILCCVQCLFLVHYFAFLHNGNVTYS
jgi:hypothetical protein